MSLAVRGLALLAVLVPTYALMCWTCDTKCGCRNPVAEECPARTRCYTLKSLANGDIVRKGCAPECLAVNENDRFCETCNSDHCNSEQSLAPMSGVDECRVENRISETRIRSLGYQGPSGSGYGGGIGTGSQYNPNQGIGGGVGYNPDSGIGSGSGYNPPPVPQGPQGSQGIGSGAGYNGNYPNSGVGSGSGYNANSGIGGGTGYNPNRPNGGNYYPSSNVGDPSYNRNNGIGHGVYWNSANSVSLWLTLPTFAIIAHII